MWSLSLPLVATPLAAAIVGLRVDLIDINMFNAVIVVMLVTAILGPVTTTRFASQLAIPSLAVTVDSPEPDLTLEDGHGGKHALSTEPCSVMVSSTNPWTERYLVEAAALIARHEAGSLIPLSIARSHVHMDDPVLIRHLDRGQKRLQLADFKAALTQILNQASPQVPTKIKVVRYEDVAKAVLKLAENFDLVIIEIHVSSYRWGVAVSGITTRIINELTCSVVLFGEPHS